jgi:hypothetical protein
MIKQEGGGVQYGQWREIFFCLKKLKRQDKKEKKKEKKKKGGLFRL